MRPNRDTDMRPNRDTELWNRLKLYKGIKY